MKTGNYFQSLHNLLGIMTLTLGLGWLVPSIQSQVVNGGDSDVSLYNQYMSGNQGPSPAIPRVMAAPTQYGYGGIRYVTIQRPTVHRQTIARNFFGAAGINFGGTVAPVNPNANFAPNPFPNGPVVTRPSIFVR